MQNLNCDLMLDVASEDLLSELNSLIAAIEPFDLSPTLVDQALDPIAMLLDDPLLDPNLLEATTKLIVDDKLVQLNLDWLLSQLEEDSRFVFANLEAMVADFDLDFILSIARDLANCPLTFVENERAENA